MHMLLFCFHCGFINSLWPSDTIWQQGFWSALAQVMACCLIVPTHYQNQCWLISKPLWHSFECNFPRLPQLSIITVSLTISCLNFLSNLPGSKELMLLRLHLFMWRIHPIFFRVASLALGQSYNCPSVSKVTTKDMGNISRYLTSTTHNMTWIMCIFQTFYCNSTCQPVILQLSLSCCLTKKINIYNKPYTI